MKGGLLESTYDVFLAQSQLAAHPEIWNQYRWRTEHPASPHREVDDIWVRYNDVENFDAENPFQFNEEHESTWYPVVDEIPAIKDLALEVMHDHGYKDLGGVLVTRIPPHEQVYSHVDSGWHAKHYEKLCVMIKADENQKFCFDGLDIVTKDGDVFWFDNSFPHWVKNDSDRERISLVVCVRR